MTNDHERTTSDLIQQQALDKALFDACFTEQPRDSRTIGELIGRGATLDQLHPGRYSVMITPLLALIQHREPDPEAEIVALLLEASADPNFADSDGRKPLNLSANYNLPEICRLLLQAGADPNASYTDYAFGGTPLHGAIKFHGDSAQQTVRILLENGADPNLRHYGRTPLHLAILENAWLVVETLLEFGAKHDFNDDSDSIIACGGSLHAAVSHHSADDLPGEERIRWLIRSGAEANFCTPDGHNALYSGAWHHPQLVPLLVELGVLLEHRDDNDMTPLVYLASQNCKAETVQALLDAGALVDARDAAGRTALWYTVETQNEANLACLLAAGAAPDTEDNDGLSALELARTRELVTLLRLLRPDHRPGRQSWLELLINAIAGRRILKAGEETFEFGLRFEDQEQIFWHGHPAHPKHDLRKSRSRAWIKERLAWLALERPEVVYPFLLDTCGSLGIDAPAPDSWVDQQRRDEAELMAQATVPILDGDIVNTIIDGLLAGAEYGYSDKEGFERWKRDGDRLLKEDGAWQTFSKHYSVAEAKRYWREWGKLIDGMVVCQWSRFRLALDDALKALEAPTLRSFLQKRNSEENTRRH